MTNRIAQLPPELIQLIYLPRWAIRKIIAVMNRHAIRRRLVRSISAHRIALQRRTDLAATLAAVMSTVPGVEPGDADDWD